MTVQSDVSTRRRGEFLVKVAALLAMALSSPLPPTVASPESHAAGPGAASEGAVILVSRPGAGEAASLDLKTVSGILSLDVEAPFPARVAGFFIDHPAMSGAPDFARLYDPEDSTQNRSRAGLFDTSLFEDGLHVLSVRVAGDAGFSVTGHAVFRIDNDRGLPPGTIHHFLVTGQSLANGGETPISTEQPFLNVMFAGGQSTWPSRGTDRFVPLISDRRESIAAGAANQATLEALRGEIEHSHADRSKNRESGDDQRISRPRLLATVNAKGGARLREIDREGGDPYGIFDKARRQVNDGRQVAESRGDRYTVGAVFFVQGEADRFDASESWLDRLVRLKDDYNEDLRAISGQSSTIPLFTYQIASTPALGPEPGSASRIPLLQLEASRTDDDIYLVAPTYFLPHADELHLTSEGYQRLGAYFGRAFERVVLRGEKWSPLEPAAVDAQGRILTLEMHVPSPPLVLDDRTLPDAGHFGFRIRAADGREIPIETVRLAGPMTVVLNAAEEIPGDARVTYARDVAPPVAGFVGGRGNLRDSESAISWVADPSGIYPALPNWCVIFDVPVTYRSREWSSRVRVGNLADANRKSPRDGRRRSR